MVAIILVGGWVKTKGSKISECILIFVPCSKTCAESLSSTFQPITSSRHRTKKSWIYKTWIFPLKIWHLFWSVLNGFLFNDQSQYIFFFPKRQFFSTKNPITREFRIHKNMLWMRTWIGNEGWQFSPWSHVCFHFDN